MNTYEFNLSLPKVLALPINEESEYIVYRTLQLLFNNNDDDAVNNPEIHIECVADGSFVYKYLIWANDDKPSYEIVEEMLKDQFAKDIKLLEENGVEWRLWKH